MRTVEVVILPCMIEQFQRCGPLLRISERLQSSSGRLVRVEWDRRPLDRLKLLSNSNLNCNENQNEQKEQQQKTPEITHGYHLFGWITIEARNILLSVLTVSNLR